MLCDGLKSPANLGALFRVCDAFGVEEIISNNTIPLSSGRFKKTARSTNEQVSYKEDQALDEVIVQLRSEGFKVIGLEITTESSPIQHFDVKNFKKIALVIGGESEGISSDLLNLLTTVVHIPMFGTNSSMNVIQAVAIALFQLTQNE